MDNLVLRAPVDIKIDDAAVGRTLGDVSVQRVRAEYAELRKQNSIHLFGLVKQGVIYEVLLPLADHTAANIARCFDVGLTGGAPNFTDSTVQEIKVYLKAEDNTTITFLKCVQAGTDGPVYSYNNITVLQLRLWVILGTEGTKATIDSVALPGQFQYRIESRPRKDVSSVYGGLQRYGAPFVDTYIHFDCEFMTSAEKVALENSFRTKQGQEVTFTGYHDEAYDVWWDTLDAPIERAGRFSTAGTLVVVGDTESE